MRLWDKIALIALVVLAIIGKVAGNDKGDPGSGSARRPDPGQFAPSKPLDPASPGEPGVMVTVDYVGVSWSTGTEFDASWNRNEAFSFPLGGGQVISGWDEGVQGMKVGGRRKLTIPPHMGYGAQGAGGVIAPNETLIFVVDLRKLG